MFLVIRTATSSRRTLLGVVLLWTGLAVSVSCPAQIGAVPPSSAATASFEEIAADANAAIVESMRLLENGEYRTAGEQAQRAVLAARKLPVNLLPKYRDINERAEEAMGKVFFYAGYAVYEREKNFLKAKEYVSKSLPWLVYTEEGKEYRVSALYLLGGILMKLNAPHLAAKRYEEAIALEKDGESTATETQGLALADLSGIYESLNELAKAAKSAGEAGRVLEGFAPQESLAMEKWGRAGFLWLTLKEYERARAAYTNALRIAERGAELDPDLFPLYVGHAEALTELGKYDDARAALKKADGLIDRSTAATPDRLWRLGIQVRIERKVGAANDVLAVLEEFLRVSKARSLPPERVTWYVNELSEAATWAYARGEYRAAKIGYRGVLERFPPIWSLNAANRKAIARIHLRLGDIGVFEGEYQEAAEHFVIGLQQFWMAEAPEIVEGLFSYNQAHEKSLAEILHWRDVVFWAASQRHESMGRVALLAAMMTKSVDDELERASRSITSIEPERFNDLARKKGELAGKTLALTSRDKRDRSELTEEPSVGSLKRLAPRFRHFESGPGARSNPELTKLAKNVRGMEQSLGRKGRVRKAVQIGALSVSALLNRLGPGDVLLEYFLLPTARPLLVEQEAKSGAKGADREHYHYAVALAKGGSSVVQIFDLGSMRALDERILVFYREYEDQASTGRLDEGVLLKKATDLRGLLLDKVLVPMGEARRVYVSAIGPIGQVSFGILPAPQSKGTVRYLAEDTEWVYLTSSRDLLRYAEEQQSTRSKTVVLVGDPEYAPDSSSSRHAKNKEVSGNSSIPMNWPRLRRTAALLDAIEEDARKGGWEPLKLSGPRARESALKQLSAPRGLLIATHGLFLSDIVPAAEFSFERWGDGAFEATPLTAMAYGGLRTMLILAGAGSRCLDARIDDGKASPRRCEFHDDGLLTAYEAMELDLRGTEVAVLFGCQTGLGGHRLSRGKYHIPSLRIRRGAQSFEQDDPMSMYNFAIMSVSHRAALHGGATGLRQAFEIAGVRSLITSVWTIPFQPNKVTIEKFFENWLIDGKARYRAFRDAELEGIKASKKAGKTHPFWWGGFVFVGDPGDLR